MQRLEKILNEIESKKEKCLDVVKVEIDPMEITIHREQYKGLHMAEQIIRKHMNDGKGNEIVRTAEQVMNQKHNLEIAYKIINDYESIGTVEKCREAVEKQKPKEPYYEGDGYADGHIVYNTWICPNCGERYGVDCEHYEHYPKCGQAISRESEEE